MDMLPIAPINHPVQTTVQVPGSKSLTNRALLIAALADGTTRLSNALFSDDSKYFAQALQTLGFKIYADPSRAELIVTGLSGRIPADKAELFIGNAGTAARFLSAFLTLGSGEFILDGDTRMRERPIGDLVSALKQLGAKLQPSASDCPPVKISASGLPGGKAVIAGNISSQFLSALLMVAPYAQRPIEITLSTDLNSKPYVDMTLAVMSDFGVAVKRNTYESFVINAGFYRSCENYVIEPDASAASYFFAAPAILGGSVRIQNITRNSLQGDIAFLDVLGKMGCLIVEGNDFVEVTGPDLLTGVDVDMRDIPDTAQTLAVIAPFATTPTHIRGIASARVKETDRVHATCVELMRLGVTVNEREDGMTIFPCESIHPASIQTYNDHRMAMAFALIGLRTGGITIENPGCVSKTFPNYFSVLETLR
jgi:3-phosphoshikimate 1-carboxyvinyltransferase